MYSQKGNHGQVYHLQTKADCPVQGEMSVTEFFSELNNMWEQMDFFDPLAMTCTVDALAFKNWLEKRRTFRFLAGLNSEFEQIRQSLWQRSPLPALRDTYVVVVQEESRRKAMTSVSVQEGSDMLSQPLTTLSQSDKSCDYCIRKNHTRETCWDLHRRPTRGRGRDGGRGRSQGRGRGQGRSGSGFKQAHVADSTGQSGSSFDYMLAQLMTQFARRFSTNPRPVQRRQLLPHQGLTVIILSLFLLL
jgi:hypothetical protein